jgi:hypothetical protein
MKRPAMDRRVDRRLGRIEAAHCRHRGRIDPGIAQPARQQSDE